MILYMLLNAGELPEFGEFLDSFFLDIGVFRLQLFPYDRWKYLRNYYIKFFEMVDYSFSVLILAQQIP